MPTTTYFPSINVSISNTWTSVLDTARSRKEDKALVPSELWDSRLSLSFNNKAGLIELVNCLRTLCFQQYRRNITVSFLHFLRKTFSSEWCSHINQSRLLAKGGNLSQIYVFNQSDLGKSIKVGRDVIEKACKASWFEWKGGSTLIFWRWHCFIAEARDGFPMFITQKDLRHAAN